MNKIVFGFLVAALLPLVSAQQCYEQHTMPPGTWTYSAWLCVNGSNYGWIYSIGPSGHPSAGRMFKVELRSFTYSPPYPATLYCYEQFTDLDGEKGGSQTLNSVRGGTLNSVPQGPLKSWHYAAQATLTDGEWTLNNSPWVLAGCPPVRNLNHQPENPPRVQIGVGWAGYGDGNNRNTAIAAPDYAAIAAPFYGALDGYIDLLTGRTASTLKNKRIRR